MIIAVTGHRPSKLGNAYDVYHENNVQVGRAMRSFILSQSGYDKDTYSFASQETTTLISGMSLGVDTVWALVALKLKKDFPGKFVLECAIPCQNHSGNWNESSKKIYQDILSQADTVTLVTDKPYAAYMMQKRNEYMVDRCDILFAVWDGSAGGTRNCVQYAIRQEKTMVVLPPFETQWKILEK